MAERFRLLRPRRQLAERARALERLRLQLAEPPRRRLREAKRALADLENRLRLLSPKNVLERGYSITRRADGSLVRAAKDVRVGDELTTVVAEGEIRSTVRK
jgi:exodeoxyribonuclease VII large subunit